MLTVGLFFIMAINTIPLQPFEVLSTITIARNVIAMGVPIIFGLSAIYAQAATNMARAKMLKLGFAYLGFAICMVIQVL